VIVECEVRIQDSGFTIPSPLSSVVNPKSTVTLPPPFAVPLSFIQIAMQWLRVSLSASIAVFILCFHLLSAEQAASPDSDRVSALLQTEQEQNAQDWSGQIFGPLMWPLWLGSLILIALIFERWKALRPNNISNPQMVARTIDFVSQLKIKEAKEEAEKSDTVVGRAWGQALHEFMLGGVTLSDALTNSTLLAFKPLKRNLQAISTLGVVAPLFGLLGTVVGMIITFGQIAATGGAEKEKLAYGIAIALFTTAGGLIIAIPAIVFGRFFSTKLLAHAEEAEAAINRMNYRHSHALSDEKNGESGGSPEDTEEAEE